MPDITDWDEGGTWDSGLDFDVNNFPSLGNIQLYLDLVPSQNITKPNFILSLSAILQPLADDIYTVQSMPSMYDIDNAVGDQLDKVGLWVGRTRYLRQEIAGVYFSFNTAGVGFNQGVWQGALDPTTGLVALPDATYRTYLKAIVLANNWDGTIPSAYAIWDQLFQGQGYTIFIQDNQDMTMYFGLVGGSPNALTLALLTGGYFNLRPSGVKVIGYYIGSVPDTPLFGFDTENSTISGFDVGAWATLLPPT